MWNVGVGPIYSLLTCAFSVHEGEQPFQPHADKPEQQWGLQLYSNQPRGREVAPWGSFQGQIFAVGMLKTDLSDGQMDNNVSSDTLSL